MRNTDLRNRVSRYEQFFNSNSSGKLLIQVKMGKEDSLSIKENLSEYDFTRQLYKYLDTIIAQEKTIKKMIKIISQSSFGGIHE